MNVPLALLGAVGSELPKHNRSFGKLPGLLFSDILLIVGLGLGLLFILASVVYLWMKWQRKRRRHVTGGERVYRGSQAREDGEDRPPGHDTSSVEEDQDEANSASQDQEAKRRYKYRVRRRSHRARNPTLAQAGGLPPVKPHAPGKPD